MTGGAREKSDQAPAVKPEPNSQPLPSARELANVGLDPFALAAGLTVQFTKGSFGDLSVCDTFEAMLDLAKAKGKDSQAAQRAMLIGQSHALNAIFVEMARRAGVNMGHSLEGMERYMRLAFKA